MNERLAKLNYDLTPNIHKDKSIPKYTVGEIKLPDLLDYRKCSEDMSFKEYLNRRLNIKGVYSISREITTNLETLREVYNYMFTDQPSDIHYHYDSGKRLEVDLIDINKVSVYYMLKNIKFNYYTPQTFGILCVEL
ncbi:hypothetical protein [Paraclostridium bifermentans]|uniref:hypothetical protein n=1 Tax=Paraclostridium bifermentans TaxID=1490 RepID=UPI00374F93A7